MRSVINTITHRFQGRSEEQHRVVLRHSASSTSVERRYSMIDRLTQMYEREQAVNAEMIITAFEKGFMAASKLGDIRLQHNDLVKLENEIIRLKSIADAWPSHVEKVQKRVKEIYTKFKALDTEVKADVAKIREPLRLERAKPGVWRSKEEGEMRGIEDACELYNREIGKFFCEVEKFYQGLPTFLSGLNQQPQQQPQNSNVQTVARTSQPQGEIVLQNRPDPMGAALQEAQHRVEERTAPVRQEYLLVQEENNRLQQEKDLIQSNSTKKSTLYHAHLKEHLTLPLKRLPPGCCWPGLSGLYNSNPCPELDPVQKEMKVWEHTSGYLTKNSEQAAKIIVKWEEVAGLINSLLTDLR